MTELRRGVDLIPLMISAIGAPRRYPSITPGNLQPRYPLLLTLPCIYGHTWVRLNEHAEHYSTCSQRSELPLSISTSWSVVWTRQYCLTDGRRRVLLYARLEVGNPSVVWTLTQRPRRRSGRHGQWRVTADSFDSLLRAVWNEQSNSSNTPPPRRSLPFQCAAVLKRSHIATINALTFQMTQIHAAL